MPANVPALVVVAARGEKGYLPPTGIQLADSTSTAVATDVEAQSEGAVTYLVKPQASLLPDHDYTLTFPDVDCSGRSDGGLASRVFRTAEASELPQRIGDVGAIVYTRAKEDVATSSGSCTSPAVVSAATVTIEPSTELDAYLGVTAFLSILDGDTTDYRPYFAGNHAPGQPLQFRYATTCSSDDGAVDPGIGAGHHAVQLKAVIAGAATQPSALEFEVDLSCDQEADDGGCVMVRAGAVRRRAGPLVGVAVGLGVLLARRRRGRASR